MWLPQTMPWIRHRASTATCIGIVLKGRPGATIVVCIKSPFVRVEGCNGTRKIRRQLEENDPHRETVPPATSVPHTTRRDQKWQCAMTSTDSLRETLSKPSLGFLGSLLRFRLVCGRKRTSACTTTGLANCLQRPGDREKEKEASHRSEKIAAAQKAHKSDFVRIQLVET